MNTAFAITSRYATTETTTLHTADGREIIYLRRRFVPAPGRFALLQEYIVTEAERPDTVAAAFLDDPEQFWRLCDANNVLRPDDLTNVVGRVLRITLPEGIPGSPYA